MVFRLEKKGDDWYVRFSPLAGVETHLLWIVLESHLMIRGVVHLLLAKLEVRSSKSHLQVLQHSRGKAAE